MQSEVKLASAISELSSKEETIATIKEASKKRELGLEEELETVAKRPKKQSLIQIYKRNQKNAQTLPHLKSSYPIELPSSCLSERYLQSESPNMDPAYQKPKLAVELKIDLDSWGAKANKDRNTDRKTVLPVRVLLNNNNKKGKN